ncbi:MAG: hypothetical protein AAF667_00505 [Pseudomonadota bacterium]
MRDERGIGVAPNYTTAFLVSFGVVVFMFLFGIWVAFGMIAAMLSGWSLDRLIVFGQNRRDQRDPR